MTGGTLQNFVRLLTRAGLDMARAMLPVWAKARLSTPALALTKVVNSIAVRSFQERSIKLADFVPPDRGIVIAGGPAVLCNNALAGGGAERQVVNTLRGLVESLAEMIELYDFRKVS